MLQLIDELEGADNFNSSLSETEPQQEQITEITEESDESEDWSYSNWDRLSQLYFREMGRFSTLSSDEEFRIGYEIRSLRMQIWKDIFLIPGLRSHILDDFQSISQDIPLPLMSFFEELDSMGESSPEILNSAATSLAISDLDEILLGCSIHRFEDLVRHIRNLKRRNGSHNQVLGIFDRMMTSYHELIENKHVFVRANLRLVISVARKYHHGHLNLVDLIQEGNIGLMKAVDRYDPDRGYRFSTYAAWWIRHSVSRATADKGRTVRLPVHFIESYQQLVKVKKDLQLKLGRPATIDEIASEMGTTTRKIDKIECYLQEGTMSLDRKVNGDDSRTFLEMLEDQTTEGGLCASVISSLEHKLSLEAIEEVLTPMEQDIIRKRYGLEANEAATLKEIGDEYNLSRERIRQIQESAIRKIRSFFSRHGML